MLHRFIEAEDEWGTNHGKFSILRFGSEELRYRSAITGSPLLAGLPPVRRFRSPIGPSTLFLLDLQTQEGSLFDPEQGEDDRRRRFLCHPLHVCILYYPLMCFLAEHQHEIWKLPNRVTLSLGAILKQPGVLLDLGGEQVRTPREWTRRPPLVARLRNREVLPDGDPDADQDVVFPDEAASPTPADARRA